MDLPTFRAVYPELSDTVAYPDSVVTRLLGLAQRMLPEGRWADMWDDGQGLFAAHSLVVQRRRAVVAAAGGVPGAIVGAVTSKGVDKVSVSYDTASVMLEDSGTWGQTTYGVQLLQWARMVGAGPVQF